MPDLSVRVSLVVYGENVRYECNYIDQRTLCLVFVPALAISVSPAAISLLFFL